MTPGQIAHALKQKARQLGFTLAGVVSYSAQPPDHLDVYKDWLKAGRHAGMAYLADNRAVERRADPGLILPECRSILVLGIPYTNPQASEAPEINLRAIESFGRIAAYAWGADYHLVLPLRLQALVAFLEEELGYPIPNRWYTDTGPILERDLAMRAGLGWIGKNTCLINPRHGSYFFLAEILLSIDLPPDKPYGTDQCGSCTRCIDACPTGCILPNRTLDAVRCISYQTIENKADIPADFRSLTGDWIFGCDICQMVCPWNIRFAHASSGDPLFAPRSGVLTPTLIEELALTSQEFNQKFRDSSLKRTKWRGYLRNVAIAAGNSGKMEMLPALKKIQCDDDPLIRESARWAISRIMDVNKYGKAWKRQSGDKSLDL